jgi:hypothetical protein
MEALLNQTELSEDEEAELTDVVREISDTIMEPVPAAIRDKLSDPQRSAVIEAFSTLLLTTKAGTAAALLRSLLPETSSPAGETGATGEKRSPASRFYGGPPGWWLAEAPIALVRALSAMLPRLQAEERLNAITDVAIGCRQHGAERAVRRHRRAPARRGDRTAEGHESERGDARRWGIAIRGPAPPPEKAVSDG